LENTGVKKAWMLRLFASRDRDAKTIVDKAIVDEAIVDEPIVDSKQRWHRCRSRCPR
jgi:hypothetical protein